MLATCGKLYGEEDLTRAAFVYLNEKIDCNDDGEYSEKFAGNYNSVNNQAMLLLVDALDDDSYEQHVIRNLRMMLTCWGPDDSIFTANSPGLTRTGWYTRMATIGFICILALRKL